MRRVTTVLSVVAVVLMAAGLVAQAKPNFAGEWKLMVARGQGEPGVDLTITQSATAMTLAYRDGVKLTYKLDGSESKNMMAGRGGGAPTEQVSKAMWAGNNIVVTTTTSVGEEADVLDGRRLSRRRNIGARAQRRSPDHHQSGLPAIRTRLRRLVLVDLIFAAADRLTL